MPDFSKSTDDLVPLYRRISDELSGRIADGEFGTGEAMPSEHSLCAMFNVSRITIRKAVDELVARRLVVRRQGRGTFVAQPHHEGWSVTLSGVIEDVLLPYHFRLVGEAFRHPPKAVLEFAGLAKSEPEKMIEGLNCSADGDPLVYLWYYFPKGIGELITAQSLVEAKGAIRAVEAATGRQARSARQVVEATIADEKVAAHLQIERGSPVLMITRVFFDANDKPLQLYQGAYHPRNYRYTASLHPRSLISDPS